MHWRLIAACLVSFFSAEVKYSSHKMALKTARGGKKTTTTKKKKKKKNMTQTQLTFSSNCYWTICVKICILDNIIAAVLFIRICSVNNKRSMLRFHSTTAPLTEGGLPVVFTVCFCLFFTYIISNFLMTFHFCEFMLHKILLIVMLCFGWVQGVSTSYGTFSFFLPRALNCTYQKINKLIGK